MENNILAMVEFTDTSRKGIKFQDVGRAKSYAGHEFNRTDVRMVEVSDSDKIYLKLDKDNPNARISIR